MPITQLLYDQSTRTHIANLPIVIDSLTAGAAPEARQDVPSSEDVLSILVGSGKISGGFSVALMPGRR